MQKIALIPAYCPEDRMIDLLKKLSELNFSVLVIDDGSGENYDAIFNKASQYADVKRYQNNRGKGEALKYGLIDSVVVKRAEADKDKKEKKDKT